MSETKEPPEVSSDAIVRLRRDVEAFDTFLAAISDEFRLTVRHKLRNDIALIRSEMNCRIDLEAMKSNEIALTRIHCPNIFTTTTP